ncbi:MAG TPA: SDR family oxidoreductase [Vicinamibacteria bacterium]|nr:SDR family oxidoreductase [Vicinamibacteria bacterium]
MPAFAGKVVVLTGASQGIGHALALALARQRARLVLAARDAARLAEVASECEELGAEVIPVPTDVANFEECRFLIEGAAASFGRLDCLVNNAGIGMIARFDEVEDLEAYERLMRVNYLSCVHLTHRALPHLKKARGLVVAVASLAGLTGVPTRTAYAASKHAVIGFFESLRVELLGSGVDVTIVAPDFVVSQIHRRAMGSDGKALGASPMQEGRIMSAERCAELIVEAMERRRRLAVLSLRGKLGRFVRLLAPGLIDRIALRAVREGK